MRAVSEAPTVRQYRRGLNAEPQALAQIRRITSARLRLWGRASLIDAVLLSLTEMLTNVARHAGSPASVVTLEDIGTGVRLTVSDTSTESPTMRQPDWSAESGRGMCLIAAAAHSYGSTVTSTGKDVWAEFRDHRETAA